MRIHFKGFGDLFVCNRQNINHIRKNTHLLYCAKEKTYRFLFRILCTDFFLLTQVLTLN